MDCLHNQQPIMSDSTKFPSRTAGRALVAALRMHGVERVFCVPGESYLEVLDALYDEKSIELIVAKHEGAAANMAEAELLKTFNCGIGMIAFVDPSRAAELADLFRAQGETVVELGRVVKGEGVIYKGKLL